MIQKRQTTPTRYILLEESHIVPLDDVTPAALRWAAKHKIRDHENISDNTVLNFLAKHMGFRGGYGGFTQEYKKLEAFMQRHSLKKRYDLVTPRHKAATISLKPRQVADRFFLSDQPMPRRIFTGYDVDWETINDRWAPPHNPWYSVVRGGQSEQVYDYIPYRMVVEHCRQEEQGPDNGSGKMLEAAVVFCSDWILLRLGKLLNDMLLSFDKESAPHKAKPVIASSGDLAPVEQKYLEVQQVFRMWIDQLQEGWVEVLPFNERLVFLKGRYGEYDFLVPGFRDEQFDHQIHEPYLKRTDLPISNDAYHFKRFLYFKYNGWLEKDEDEARTDCVANGHTPADYPGPDEVLKKYFIKKGVYSPPTKPHGPAPGFHRVKVNGTGLYVSNLISEQEFEHFMREGNPEHAAYSRQAPHVDAWEPVNCDEDKSLPAAVTWYDANAYAAWISKTKHLPVRLLTGSEYLALGKLCLYPLPEISDKEFFNFGHNRLCRFFDEHDIPFDGHPPYMKPEEFDRLKVRYIPEGIKWQRTGVGLTFLVSHHFGEWLNERGAAVNCLTLSTLCSRELPPTRPCVNPTSTGKYKSKKIGFRLCYLADNQTANKE